MNLSQTLSNWSSEYLQSRNSIKHDRNNSNGELSSRRRPRPSSLQDDSDSNEFHWLRISPPLAALWLGDIFMALSVTVSVAPLLTAVDKAIVQQAAAGSRNVMGHSFKQTMLGILSNPSAYYRSPTFGWMALTYIATYTTANMLKTWTDYPREHEKVPCSNKRQWDVIATKPSGNDSFVIAATTVANSAASLVKDRAYARMFGQVPRPVPALSYFAWLSRDAFGIGSGFVLPKYVSPHLQAITGWSPSTSESVAQVTTPVLAQTIAAPLHLLGLTIYNAKPTDSLVTQFNSFSSSVQAVTVARMLRFLPGYGIAGVLNQQGRTWWKEKVRKQLFLSDNEEKMFPPAKTLAF